MLQTSTVFFAGQFPPRPFDYWGFHYDDCSLGALITKEMFGNDLKYTQAGYSVSVKVFQAPSGA
jgi:hypothetical protein